MSSAGPSGPDYSSLLWFALGLLVGAGLSLWAGSRGSAAIVAAETRGADRPPAIAESADSAEAFSHAATMARIYPWTFDLATRMFITSAEGAVVIGWSPGPHSLEELIAAVHPEDLPRMQSAWLASATTGQAYDIEHRLFFGGAYHWVHVKARFYADRAGAVVRAVGVTQDITERREAAERIQALADRFTLATRAAGIGIWDYDLRSGRVVWSDEMYRLYGVADGGEGCSYSEWQALVHPEDRERIAAEHAAVLTSGREYSSQFRIRRRDDGRLRMLKVRAILYQDDDGRPVRVLGTNWDITEHYQALSAAEEARALAEAASAAKSRFLANMSHELRTPLNAIIGFASLLTAGQATPEQKENLDIIEGAGKHLLTLIENILQLSRIESGGTKINPTEFSMAAEMDFVRSLFGPEAGAKGVGLIVTGDPALDCTLWGDYHLFRRILINLIGNAVKFTIAGRVEVRAETADQPAPGTRITIVCHVIDTGIGIRPENRDRIFEMFEQEDNSTTRQFGGPGLGLAISQRLATMLGGRIWLQSTSGRGSHFAFSACFEVVSANPARRTAARGCRPAGQA
ncbi:MAG: PAS domain-containing protein [Rhodospirillaceae bacterium]